MKKIAPILHLFSTCNFLDEVNKTGKAIDFSREPVFTISPSPELASRLLTLGGHIKTGTHHTTLLMPLDFSVTPPASKVSLLPENLDFYIFAANQQKLLFSGLNFNRRLLWLGPLTAKTDYTFNKRTVSCAPCGSEPVLSEADLRQHIPFDLSFDNIQHLVGASLGDNKHLPDLKVTVNATTVILTTDGDLKKLHALLSGQVNNVVALELRKNSDNTILQNFPAILVTASALRRDVIGMIRIPRVTLELTETQPDKYADLNNFIIHFPVLESKLAITLNARRFEPGFHLFMDEQEIAGPGIVDHPMMPGYKLVTGQLPAYTSYSNKLKQVIIKDGTKLNSIPVNPINNYNPSTNTATINITN